MTMPPGQIPTPFQTPAPGDLPDDSLERKAEVAALRALAEVAGKVLVQDDQGNFGVNILGLDGVISSIDSRFVIGTEIQAFDPFLLSIAALGTAADKLIFTTGVDVAAETPITSFGRSLIDDANAAGARTTLGLVIGTNVQAWDAQLDDIAALGFANGNFIVGDGANWIAESGNTARTSLGLGTGDSPTFNDLTINGDIDVVSGDLQIGGTSVIDSSRNLVNIVALTMTGDITQNRGANIARHIINADAGNVRQIQFQSGGLSRWLLRTDAAAESGSDAGSDFALLARTDAGGTIDTPLTLVRAAGGLVTLARPVKVTGAIELDGDLNHDGSNIGFFAIAPAARAGVTDDIKDALTAYGLLQGTSATPLNLDGGVLTAGAATVNGDITQRDGDTLFWGADMHIVGSGSQGGVVITAQDASGDSIKFTPDKDVVITRRGLTRSVASGLTASTTQAQGEEPLTEDINEVATVANVNDVVTLRTAREGGYQTIINNGANILQIFPATGDDLGSGVNASTTLAASESITFLAYDITNWKRVANGNGLLKFQFFADQFDNPVNADWTINALAPAAADSNNAGETVRLFDDTAEEGIGFILTVPSNAINIKFTFRSRAETTPGAVRTVGLKLYNRGIPNNAAVEAWSAGTVLTDIDIPVNETFQEDTQTLTLATLGLTAGETTQFELTRINPVGGTELTGDWALLELIVEFT